MFYRSVPEQQRRRCRSSLGTFIGGCTDLHGDSSGAVMAAARGGGCGDVCPEGRVSSHGHIQRILAG
jgi:hypothetical protein